MRQIVLTLLLVLLGSPTAWAGNSNPDQLDVDSTFYSESPKDATTNSAYVFQSGDENRADGFVRAYGESQNAGVSWNLYSPDAISRRSDRGSLSQRSFVNIGFSTWDSTDPKPENAFGTWGETTTEKCRAATRVRGSDDSPEEARWRVSCRNTLETLDFDELTLRKLDRILGRYVNTDKGAVRIRGHGPVVIPTPTATPTATPMPTPAF